MYSSLDKYDCNILFLIQKLSVSKDDNVLFLIFELNLLKIDIL